MAVLVFHQLIPLHFLRRILRPAARREAVPRSAALGRSRFVIRVQRCEDISMLPSTQTDTATIPFTAGDVRVLHCTDPAPPFSGTLPWIVVRLKPGAREELLGRFARQSDAVCFALTSRLNGWPSSDVLRAAAQATVNARYEPDLQDRLAELAIALGATAPAPRVLIVVDQGVARAYATPGVWVGTADLDTRRSFGEDELAPMHVSFGELLSYAGVPWPLSQWGRRQSATVVTPGATQQKRASTATVVRAHQHR